MSELRVEEFVMPAANLGPPSPLVPFVVDTANLVTNDAVDDNVPRDEAEHIGYGYVDGCLPYLIQDEYDRQRRPRSFRAVVLENELLKATFLIELGGRLWSLIHKPDGRELLFVNPIFQPANLGIRDAWFSGGVEWNFCWIGHTPFTCSPLFAGREALDDGTPVLRMWEWERVRQMPYQIDAYLPDGSPVLYVRVRLVNGYDRTVPIYWWSNIAAPETTDTRVLCPADSALAFDYSGRLSVAPYPNRNGVDLSYPTHSAHAADYFFRIPQGHYPWVASANGCGKGFFHASTDRLTGRKVWVFGMGAGGRQWQNFLNPGHAYIEIQGGLTRMQSQCLPMPPRTEWTWLEVYGPLDADPDILHGDHWQRAWQLAEQRIEAVAPREGLIEQIACTKEMAQRPPLEILYRGSGWGAMERLRRQQADEPPIEPSSLVFDDDSLSQEQAPWLELLRTGSFPEADPREAPTSYMIQDQWRAMLEDAIESGRSNHWAAWLHLGIMHVAHKRYDEARRAWEKSVSLRPSAWALRHLAALALLEERYEESARLYLLAVDTAPAYARLVIECGRALLGAGQHHEWFALLDRLEPSVRRIGRVRLLEAQAALAVDDLDRAGSILEDDLVVTDVREGEGGPAHLWYRYQAKRLAAIEGIPVDEQLEQRVRREIPPPSYLDFRLGD